MIEKIMMHILINSGSRDDDGSKIPVGCFAVNVQIAVKFWITQCRGLVTMQKKILDKGWPLSVINMVPC